MHPIMEITWTSLKPNSLETWAIRTTQLLLSLCKVIKDNIEFNSAKIRNIQLYLHTNVYHYMKNN